MEVGLLEQGLGGQRGGHGERGALPPEGYRDDRLGQVEVCFARTRNSPYPEGTCFHAFASDQ